MSHCHQSECILLRGERDRMCCLLSSFVILFIIEQGPLQIFGPLVELYYCLALEKIYRMLIPRIRAFSLADLWGQTILSQRGGHGHPRTPHPSAYVYFPTRPQSTKTRTAISNNRSFAILFPSMVVSRLARENDLKERENHRFVANL